MSTPMILLNSNPRARLAKAWPADPMPTIATTLSVNSHCLIRIASRFSHPGFLIDPATPLVIDSKRAKACSAR